MKEENPESYFNYNYDKIRKLFREYKKSLITKPDHYNGQDFNPFHDTEYCDFKFESIPDSSGTFFELLDTDNYILNILGEPYFMLLTLVQKGVIPEKSELYGLASLLKFNKRYKSKSMYQSRISKSEFFYKHLSNWSKNLKIIDSKIFNEEFNEVLTKNGFDNNEYWKGKPDYEKVIHTDEGINKLYDLLSDPKYVFITNDYFDIVKKIFPHHWSFCNPKEITHSCICGSRHIFKIVNNKPIYDFNPALKMLTKPAFGEHNHYQKRIDYLKKSRLSFEPDDLHFFQNALLKNKLKNAILIADLYSSNSIRDYSSINEEKYQNYINQEQSIKDAVTDWEDTMNELGIHEDEL
ncbi:hypothetical protein [Rufibacter immobilis]|uniref:hypothetical protein n=1 Tax=Rufibacter immobilis TaxID=1348778 RepID=UPI0035EC2CF6